MVEFFFNCLIIGDSLGVGISSARPECTAVVRSGITSERWFKEFKFNPFYRDTLYKVVVISLGTNDHYNGNIEENLYNIRKGARGQMVVWVLPNPSLKPIQRDIILKLAHEFGDRTVEALPYVGYDGIHPDSLAKYRQLSKDIFD